MASLKAQPNPVIDLQAHVQGNSAAIDGKVNKPRVVGMRCMRPDRRSLQHNRVAKRLTVFNQGRRYSPVP